MKTIFKITLLVTIVSIFYNCKPDDETTAVEARDRAEVFEDNITEIETYLKSNYMAIGANNQVTVTKIPDGGTQTSIWDEYKSSLFNNEVPFITVKNDARNSFLTDGRIDDDVDYKLYYIVLNEGGGATPTSVDSTFVAYKGWDLENEVFDQNISGYWSYFPGLNSSDPVLISGFRQILKKIKTASSFTENPNGSIDYLNYGNVVVFIPSGLAYYDRLISNSTYNPLVFQIKLFDLKENDHDKDRVLSKFEDLNTNGDYFDDDTDGDKIPDFLDTDDDGDGFLTKYEIKKPTPFLGISNYYPFNPSATEPKGIPDKLGDGTNPTRLRRHLDKTSKPPFSTY